MQEFIQMVTSKLGTSEEQARNATSGLLGFVQQQIGGSDFSELASKIPGVEQLLQNGAAQGDSAGGGMLGGLMQSASSMMGGGLGSAMGLMGLVKQSGMDIGQAGSFGTMFLEFVKDKAGEDLLGRILNKIPELKNLAG